jgi:acetylornithine deacetylase/succinyl-diaminopimelate desuccinylase-like protein
MTSTRDIPKAQRMREWLIAGGILFALALATTAAVLWKQREDEAIQNRLYIPQPAEVTAEVRMLQEYVRIDTSTPEGSAEGARWLASQLRSRGVQAELFESTPGRLNVYARIAGREAGGGLILFNHIDVVSAGDLTQWQTPPFSGEIAVDTMWGRGTLDMKAIAICQLIAFAGVAASDQLPAHDLVFLATAEEEMGSDHGMKWILANRPEIFEGIAFGITEGGITELMSEKITYFGIEVGGKQVVEIPLYAESSESLQEVRRHLEPHFARDDHDRVLPEVEAYFRTIAPTRMGNRELLSDIQKTIRDGNLWRLPLAYRDLLQNSATMTAPSQSNDRWTATVRLINLPDEKPERRVEWLRSELQNLPVQIGAPKRFEGPVALSPTGTTLYETLASTAEEMYKAPAGALVLYRSGSDSRFLRARGIACYGLSPFPVNFFQSTTIHAPNERIRIDYFMDGVRYLHRVVADWSDAG